MIQTKINNTISLYDRKQMHPNFKLSDKIIKNIIHRYISLTDPKLQGIIFHPTKYLISKTPQK